jgi:hypothetical protein
MTPVHGSLFGRVVPPIIIYPSAAEISRVIFVIDALQCILLLKRVSSASRRQLFFIKKLQSMKIEGVKYCPGGGGGVIFYLLEG